YNPGRTGGQVALTLNYTAPSLLHPQRHTPRQPKPTSIQQQSHRCVHPGQPNEHPRHIDHVCPQRVTAPGSAPNGGAPPPRPRLFALLLSFSPSLVLSFYINDTGSRSTLIRTPPLGIASRGAAVRTQRPIACDAPLRIRCIRHRSLIRSIGHGAGPTTSNGRPRRAMVRSHQSASADARAVTAAWSSPLTTRCTSDVCGG